MGLFNFFKPKIQTDPNTNSILEDVIIKPGLTVAKAFADNWDLIEKTKLDCINIIATPEIDLDVNKSSFGYYPKLPVNFEYPKDKEGELMYPLAQINFAEIPALKGYPDCGYLQFYISISDDIYGLDFDNPFRQENFRVIYFEESEMVNCISDYTFLEEVIASDMSPIFKPHSLRFKAIEDFVGMNDIRYDEKLIEKILGKYPNHKDLLNDKLYDYFQCNNHKIGGYAYFTQSDPRDAKTKDYVLLLQIDSDDEIMWGDVGVANFFIHPNDLAKKDFSKVMYNWDCC